MQALLNGVETAAEDIVETIGQFPVDGEMAIGAPGAAELYTPHCAPEVIVELVGCTLVGRVNDFLARGIA